MESLDYRHHTVHTNSTLARPDREDANTYTILVSHDDPNSVREGEGEGGDGGGGEGEGGGGGEGEGEGVGEG